MGEGVEQSRGTRLYRAFGSPSRGQWGTIALGSDLEGELGSDFEAATLSAIESELGKLERP